MVLNCSEDRSPVVRYMLDTDDGGGVTTLVSKFNIPSEVEVDGEDLLYLGLILDELFEP